MTSELDAVAPNYRAAVERWPEAPNLGAHYQAVADSLAGNAHGLIETVKSFVECVCLTILGDFGQPLPSARPTTTELLVASLRMLGVANTRGASKLDKVLSSYNSLADALSACRNEVGPIAHGKDGFLDVLCQGQLRTYLLTGDALLALLLAALDGTEPNLQYTRQPYETFGELHNRIDASAFAEARVDDENGAPMVVISLGTSGLPDGIELRIAPSELLYALDRAAYIELLAASTTRVLEDETDLGPEQLDTESVSPEAVLASAPSPQFAAVYGGELQHLGVDLTRYLESLALKPDGALSDSGARLVPSLLLTAEQFMGVDWRERETLQSGMRVAFRRVLVRFGVASAEAKEAAEHIVSWLRLQSVAGTGVAEEKGMR